MKKAIFGALGFAAFAVILMATSCKDDKCPDGFVSVNNTCICPEDKFEGNGMCRDLKPNEYFASLGHCACTGTVFAEIIERNDNGLRIRFDLGWGFEENGCGLIKMPDGDSLYTEAGIFTNEFACPINGRLTSTRIFGKFIENDSKIRVTLKYMDRSDLDVELGRCDFILHK